MIELSMDGDHAAVGVAGDTLNTAIYLKRTAPAIQVDYVTRLGQEPFSRKIRDFIAAQRVDVDAIEYDVNGTPGLYAITTDAGGERSFTYWRNQSAARKMFQTTQGPNFGALKGYDVLYLSGISLAILPQETRETLLEWLAGYQSRGGRVVYDSNHRPKLWPDAETAQKVNAEMWAIADIALPSVDDEAVLSGESPDEIAARFLRLGKTGALKRGPSGPLCLATGAVDDYRQAARVVDTTAAGDSFNGGYLGALFQGANQAEALRVGHDLAARVVGYKGAIVPT